MVITKTEEEIKKMAIVNRMVAEVLCVLKEKAKEGVTTEYLNEIAEKEAKKRNARPAFKGYNGFPKALCTSINEGIVHGIPSRKVSLHKGDIVGLDFGLIFDDFYGDSAITVAIGKISDENKKLLKVTENALYAGIEQAKPGNFLLDISRSIEETVHREGFSVVRDFTGHGIGRNLHEDPEVLNYVPSFFSLKLPLVVGMTIAIEPMVNVGTYKVKIKKDGWTAVTADGKPSAHFEHTIAITENGPMILSIC
ncbi:MAG: type I methionyl aminopeptidase [Deltaproteobacteria bacterium]|nr:type I methionyl aminopeptidase [Deltaproteobacteria bacterium]